METLVITKVSQGYVFGPPARELHLSFSHPSVLKFFYGHYPFVFKHCY